MLQWRHFALVHREDLPQVTVEVFESVSIHPSVILRRTGRASTRRNGFLHHRIDFLSAADLECIDDLGIALGVGNLLLGESAKELLYEKHGKDIFTDHHAGRILIGKLRVEGEPEFGKELDGFFEVLDRQIDEDLLNHGKSIAGGNSVWILLNAKDISMGSGAK